MPASAKHPRHGPDGGGMSATYHLQFDDVLPQSFNRVGGTSSWRVWQTHKKAWEDRMVAAIVDAGIPAYTGLFARTTAVLEVPTRRRRDAGNFGVILEKALGDALQRASVIPDDTPEWWSWTSVSFRNTPREKRTVVVVQLTDPVAVDGLGVAA